MTIDGPPIDVAFDVAIDVNGTRLPAGQIRQARGTTVTWQIDASLTGAPPQRALLILTPNPNVARDSVDLNEIWGRPITIENVPLERYDLEEEKEPVK